MTSIYRERLQIGFRPTRVFSFPHLLVRSISNRSKSTKLWECITRRIHVYPDGKVIDSSIWVPRFRWKFRYIKKYRWMGSNSGAKIEKFHFYSWKTIGHWLRFKRNERRKIEKEGKRNGRNEPLLSTPSVFIEMPVAYTAESKSKVLRSLKDRVPLWRRPVK